MSIFHRTNFIFHAMDPATNQIVDFDEFFSRISEDELIAQLRDCQILSITVSLVRGMPLLLAS